MDRVLLRTNQSVRVNGRYYAAQNYFFTTVEEARILVEQYGATLYQPRELPPVEPEKVEEEAPKKPAPRKRAPKPKAE